MKRLLIFFMLFGLCSIPVLAQDVPLAEVFGGYQLLHDAGDTEDGVRGGNYHGFITSFEGKIASYAGIVGEFGYNNHSEENGLADSWNNYSLVFGPRFTAYQAEQYRIFGHCMVGANKTSINGGILAETDWNVAFVLGGGMDIVLNKTISVRVAQLDVFSVRRSEDRWSMWSNHFRYSGGVVFKFGSR